MPIFLFCIFMVLGIKIRAPHMLDEGFIQSNILAPGSPFILLWSWLCSVLPAASLSSGCLPGRGDASRGLFGSHALPHHPWGCKLCWPGFWVTPCTQGFHCVLRDLCRSPRSWKEICKDFPFATACLCEIEFSSYILTKRICYNTLNSEASMRIYLSFVQWDTGRFAKV